ncbi:MAG: hypothetical protein GF417_12040 [Candidatus Latescibacteria bacterium]|nr:hypothetical protein [Candidatus Latescibacterota bacterium]
MSDPMRRFRVHDYFCFCFLLALMLAPSVILADDSGTLNVALTGIPDSHSLWDTNDGVSQMIFLNNTFECLVRYRDDYKILEPCLATSWDVEESGRVWAFTLRDDVYFHDGSKLSTDDVIESYRRIPSCNIVVERIDDLRFRCILPEKRSNFLKSIVQPRYVIARILPDSTLAGTGPFRLALWNPKESVRLERFDQYWGGAAPLDVVIYHPSLKALEALSMMRRGEIDLIDIITPDLARTVEDDHELILESLDAVNICHVHINIERTPLDQIEFRRALNLAVDKESILDEAYHGQARTCGGLLPPVIGGESETPARIGYDPAEARMIIEKYSESTDRVLKVVGLPYSRPYCPDPEAVAEMILSDLESVGLSVEYVSTSSMSDYRKKMIGSDYDLLIGGWIIDSRDPDVFLTSLFSVDGPGSGYYSVNWSNMVFRSSILQARSTVSIHKKWRLYQAATDEFFREYPWILLAHTNQQSVHRKVTRGLKISLTGEMRLGKVSKTSF